MKLCSRVNLIYKIEKSKKKRQFFLAQRDFGLFVQTLDQLFPYVFLQQKTNQKLAID